MYSCYASNTHPPRNNYCYSFTDEARADCCPTSQPPAATTPQRGNGAAPSRRSPSALKPQPRPIKTSRWRHLPRLPSSHTSVAMPPNQGLPMVGGSIAATPMVVTPTGSAPLGGGHLTQQSILGAFAPTNQPATHAPKSYAEATHGLKLKEPAQQALNSEAASPTTTATAVAQAGRPTVGSQRDSYQHHPTRSPSNG